MALDAFYYAVAEDSEMFRLAQQDQLYTEALLSLRTFVALSKLEAIPEFHLKHIPKVTELVVLTKEIEIAHPGIEERRILWGRHWDMVYYLLSAARRENRDPSTRSEEIIRKAFFGSTQIPNPQSYIYHIPAHEVVEAANHLAQLDIDSLRPLMDVADIKKAGVYKFRQPRETDEEFEMLRKDIVIFRDFYVLVAQHNEGLVTYLG